MTVCALRALAAALRAARIKRGLSQAQLAEASGVSQTAVSAYERGAKSPPALVLARIARALRVSADRLLRG